MDRYNVGSIDWYYMELNTIEKELVLIDQRMGIVKPLAQIVAEDSSISERRQKTPTHTQITPTKLSLSISQNIFQERIKYSHRKRRA